MKIQKNVKIVSDGTITHLYIDGVEIKNCRAYSINHHAGGLPTVSIEVIALGIEIEQNGAMVEMTKAYNRNYNSMTGAMGIGGGGMGGGGNS